MTTSLEKLKQEFDAHRAEWLKEGRGGTWALVSESGLYGFFPRYDAAVTKAIEVFGERPFLIQQVLKEDRTESIQHVFWTGPWAATPA